MKKKFVILLLGVLLIVPFFSGCRGSRGYKGLIDVDLPKDVAGTLTVGCKDESQEVDAMNRLIASFKSEYPNVTVKLEKMNSQDYNQTVIQYYQADQKRKGMMPDILEFAYEVFPFIDKKVIKNLQPYVDLATEKGLLDKNDYHDALWKTGQKHFNGDQYLIPRSYDHAVTYYNKSIMAAAKAAYPELVTPYNGWTWDEFVITCRAIRKYFDDTGKSSRYLIDSYIDWECVHNAIFESCGVTYFDAENNVALDNKGTRDALALMKQMVDERWIGPYGGSSSNAGFESGDGPMMFHSTVTRKRFSSPEALGPDLGVASFPFIGDNPVVGAGAVGYAIYELSENPNLAWAFLTHMLSVKGQNDLCEAGNIVPIRKDLMMNEDAVWRQYPKDDQNQVVFTKGEQDAFVYRTDLDRPTSFMVKFDPAFSKDLMDAVKQLVMDVTGLEPKTIDKAVQDAEKRIYDILYDPY